MRTSFHLHSKRKKIAAVRDDSSKSVAIAPTPPPKKSSSPVPAMIMSDSNNNSATITTTTTGTTSTNNKKRVLRSLSVPTNLPDVAEKFMTAVVELSNEQQQYQQQRQDLEDQQEERNRKPLPFVPATVVSGGSSSHSINSGGLMSKLVVPISSVNNNNNTLNHPFGAGFVADGNGFLPLSRADSLGSEQDFFLPFDIEEDDDDVAAVVDSSSSPFSSKKIGNHANAGTTSATPTSIGCSFPPQLNQIQRQQPGGTTPSPQPTTATIRSQRQQQKIREQRSRQAAVASLEAFFLGETTSSSLPSLHAPSSAVDSSPVSAFDFDAHQQQQQQCDRYQRTVDISTPRAAAAAAAVAPPGTTTTTEDETPNVNNVVDDDRVVRNDDEYGCTENENDVDGRRFSRLQKLDRTTSLPLDISGSVMSRNSLLRHSNSTTFTAPHKLPRKSSLKKMSSYGQFPPMTKTTPPGSPILKRNVSFGSMKIREYNVAISDHPSCSYGPPIQLSWDYTERDDETLDSYEEKRRTTHKRRSGHELLLSFYERHFMLIKTAGYSKSEIRETMKEVERVKRERMVTDMFLPTQQIDEQMENVVDTVKRLFRVGK
jgi:hypothetical protein